jgi:hypothetical protein
MSLTKCSKCQSKAVRSYARPGRTIRYRNIAAMPIPDSFPIPTCSRCHAEFFDARTSEAWLRYSMSNIWNSCGSAPSKR